MFPNTNTSNVVPISVTKVKDLLILKMPSSYRRHMLPSERQMLRKDLIKITEVEEKIENRAKRFRLRIDDLRDGDTYQSNLFTKDEPYQKAGVVLFKSKDQYTIAFADLKLECSKFESDDYMRRKMEFMDNTLDARRKQNDLERVVQDKSKKIQNVPNLKLNLQQEEESESSLDQDNSHSRSKKNKNKQKKDQHRIQFSDSESKSIKKVRQNEDSQEQSEQQFSEESVEEEFSVDQKE